MTAREEFNHMLNACAHPRAVYNALWGLAQSPIVQKQDNPREAIREAVQEGGAHDAE